MKYVHTSMEEFMKTIAKRLVALVLVLSITLSLFSGCGQNVPIQTETPIETETPIITTEAPHIEYTVSFVGGDEATGIAPSSMTMEEGGTFIVPQNTFEKEGYAFYGYWTGWEYIYPGDTYEMTSQNLSFTAIW